MPVPCWILAVQQPGSHLRKAELISFLAGMTFKHKSAQLETKHFVSVH